MQFHQITHPDGRLEFDTVETRAKARAKEVGGTSEAVEIATDKKSLLEKFNELASGAPAGVPITAPAPIADEAAPAPRPAPTTTCPKCKFNHRSAEQYVSRMKLNLTVEAVKEWIEERDGWELSAIVEATTRRLSDMARRITGKGQDA